MSALDLDFVRNQFAVFRTPAGRQTAFLDNAGGSFAADAVVDRLTDFYRHYKVQPYGPNPLAERAGRAMDEGRQVMADLLNVAVGEVTLGASSTQNLNTLALASAPLLREGSEVIVTGQDHEANIGGWERICRLRGARLRFWPVDPQTGELTLAGLQPLLNERTAILCMTHSSNIIGSINPVNEVAGLLQPYGTRLVVDGVSFAPHEWPDLDELRADAYVFSTYKTYGPHLGVMVVRPSFRQELDPQCHFFNTGYDYKLFDSAGPDHAAIASLAGIGDYFAALYNHHFGADTQPLFYRARRVARLMNAHEHRLGTLLLAGLADLPIRIYGRDNMQGREANIAFRTGKMTSTQLVHQLAEHHIAAKNSHFYAYRLLQAMAIEDLDDGLVRLSLSHYNTEAEVIRCVEALSQILR